MIYRIRACLWSLVACDTLEDLEEQFHEESAKFRPADCLCWNVGSLDWSHLIGCRSNEQHDRWLLMNQEVFNHYVDFHPVLMRHHISVTAQRVMRMSDCQSPSDFLSKNPFFYEIYRHLGFHYQISYSAAPLADHKILLTWSREVLRADLRVMCGFVDAGLPAQFIASLTSRDAHLLGRLFKCSSREEIAREMGILWIPEIVAKTVAKNEGFSAKLADLTGFCQTLLFVRLSSKKPCESRIHRAERVAHP